MGRFVRMWHFHKFNLDDASAQDRKELCLSSNSCAAESGGATANRVSSVRASAAGSIGTGANVEGIIWMWEVRMDDVLDCVRADGEVEALLQMPAQQTARFVVVKPMPKFLPGNEVACNRVAARAETMLSMQEMTKHPMTTAKTASPRT